ncbi:MAG TPA: PQQ-dependent sugar dehydrogenase [Steroidobacteraceae bacterium]|nr:PQQ-dependent sugar dehydrogenase [Steroidobacteraceae bacterium]
MKGFLARAGSVRPALGLIALAASGIVAAQQAAIGIPPPSLTQPSYSFDTAEQHGLKVQVVARGLNHPFAIALLPEGDALISERGGALRLLRNAVGAPGRPTALEAAPVPGLPAIEKAYRNAGLHDLALHPDYARNHLVYFTFNKPGDMTPASGSTPARQQSRLAVMRARFDGKSLADVQEIFLGKSGGTSGSRIAFSADGLLYIQIGAAFGDEAQRMDNTIGKVLRVKDDGSIPADNPWVGQKDVNPAVFTRGHRDPLALAWHPSAGVMLSAEHGPNGGDELNVIRGGRNYGWPVVTYGHGYDGAVLAESPVAPGMEPPLVYWVPSIGPSGLAVYTGDRFPAWKNNVFVGSVRRGEIPGTGGLERVVLNDKLQELRRETLLTGLHQRIRDVRQGADGLLYVLTDENDGALLRLEPEIRP